MSSEKFPIVPADSAKRLSVSETKFEALPLVEKAKGFLLVIKEVTAIFNTMGVWDEDEDKKRAFVDPIMRYEAYCNDLICGVPEVTKFRGITEAKRQRYPFDVTENTELDDAIINFEHLVELFFNGVVTDVQENILNAFVARIANGETGNNEVKFFSRIGKKLQYCKLLKDLDDSYNCITDIFFNIYAVSEAVKTHKADKTFLFFQSWTPHFPQIELRTKERSESKNRKDPSPLTEQEEENYLKEACALLTEENVYAEIEIDEKLFLGETFEGKDREIKSLFEELAKVTSQMFLERLQGISSDLLTIVNMPGIEETDRTLVRELQQNLEEFIVSQVFFCEIAQAAVDKLNAGAFTYLEALSCFLSIYNGAAFKTQVEQLPVLLDRLGSLNVFFKKNKEKCKELPTISSGYVNYVIDAFFVQTCVRRKDLAEKIFKCFPLKDQNDTGCQLKEIYRKICYAPSKSEFLIDIRKRGYIRPKDFKKTVNRLENKLNTPYSLAYILIRLEASDILKKAFLYFANKRADTTHKLRFFQELYLLLDSKREALLFLEDLMPLKHYFNSENLLKLSESSLAEINAVFDLKDIHPVLVVNRIITILMPILVQIHDDLERILREFQFSFDIIDILPDVPEIKEKLNSAKTLAALNQHDIAALPPFWRDIFIHKDSAVVSAFSDKQQLLTLSENMPSSMGETLNYSLDTSKFVIDMQGAEGFITNIGAIFDSIARIVQDRKKVNFKNFVKHPISILTTSVMDSDEEDDSSVDPIAKAVLEEHSERLIHILEQEFRRRTDAFIIPEDKLSSHEKNLYGTVLESLIQDGSYICKIILKALLSNAEFIRCLSKNGGNVLTYMRSDEEKSVPSGEDARAKQKFISLLRQELERMVQEECSAKLRKVRLALFMESRCAIAQTFIMREIGRQIELLEKSNIFHPDCLQILREKEHAIYIEILRGCKLYEEEDRLFLSNYAKTLLEIPAYILKTIPDGFTKELVQKQNIWHTEFVAVRKPNLNKDVLTALLRKAREDYYKENKELFHKMKKARSPFRLFVLIRSKLREEIYKNLAERIAVESSKKSNPTRMDANLASETPGMIGSRFFSNDRPRPNNNCPDTPSTPLSATIGITGTGESFQNLVGNVDAEIAADSSQRWRVNKYIIADGPQLTPTPCADPTRCNYIEVYESKDLVFTAQMQKAKASTSTSLPKEDISVTAYRHKDSDVTNSVKHMIEVLRATGKSTLDISIPDSTSEEEKLDLIKKYVAEALEHNVLPRVILGGGRWKSNELEDFLEKNLRHLVGKYKNQFETFFQQRFFSADNPNMDCASTYRKSLTSRSLDQELLSHQPK